GRFVSAANPVPAARQDRYVAHRRGAANFLRAARYFDHLFHWRRFFQRSGGNGRYLVRTQTPVAGSSFLPRLCFSGGGSFRIVACLGLGGGDFILGFYFSRDGFLPQKRAVASTAFVSSDFAVDQSGSPDFQHFFFLLRRFYEA